MTNEEAIGALVMCQELMLFDPMTGETHELWQENKDNQDLYNACTMAIEALRAQAERENTKTLYDWMCKDKAFAASTLSALYNDCDYEPDDYDPYMMTVLDQPWPPKPKKEAQSE